MQTPQQAIVIGAGIAGCSTAYALAKRGIMVTLVERHATIAQEASGNPVGILYPKFNAGENLLSDIARHGFSFTLALLKQLPNSQNIHQLCGQIQLAFNAREQEKQTKLMQSPVAQSNMQLLSAAEASDIANIKLTQGGLYLPESGWVKPPLFCQALTQSPAIHKRLATQAATIQKLDNGWQVALDDAVTLEADMVVLCNANDILQFSPCEDIPITPVRGQVNFFAANTGSQDIKTVICSDHYLSPAIDGMHTIGTSYAPNDLNAAISAQDTQENLQALQAISPTISQQLDQNTVTARVAWRSATRDYIPLAGQLVDGVALKKTQPRYNDHPSTLPWLTGLYINAGHGSKGMVTAPMCGELIANLATQTPSTLPKTIVSALNPSRFSLKAAGLKQIAQNLYQF